MAQELFDPSDRRRPPLPDGERARTTATPVVQRPLVKRPSHLVLRVTAGRDAFRFVALEPGQPAEVGRDADCAISLADPSVSRRHARLTREGLEVLLEDLGSTNGTTLNDGAVKKATARAGDRLEVGSVPLRLDLVNEDELSHLQRVLQRLDTAGHDPLTRLLSRAYLDADLPDLLAASARADRPVSCVFVDVDHFKRVNDAFGHAVGDDVLRLVARSLLFGVRERDQCIRYGGEEMLVILEGANESRAAIVADRIRRAVETQDWSLVAPELAVTISCGVAAWTPEEPVKAWLERADKALYAAKHGGRNRVKRAGDAGR